MPKLTFFFDYASPYAYLGATQVAALADKHHAPLTWHPFLLGGLFRAIGTPLVPLFEMSAAKRAYQGVDIQRWADHYQVAYTFPSRFPMNTVKPLRMALQLDSVDRPRLVLPLFRAYWADDRDISDAQVLRAIADEAGFDGAALLAGCADPSVKSRLHETTEQARAAGVCGAPSFLVQSDDEDDGMLFWGQDRLGLIDKALAGWRPACG
ncbi:MAG TPA: 2-hydroxychromene-2-carboxylate isomerase [Sorangium sp.]|nr:2-hydroxychromene-2-carboxylate isomerase [Sorangium sp.]